MISRKKLEDAFVARGKREKQVAAENAQARARAEANARSGGSSVPASGSSQSHADYMKAVNDYLYGSQKSSLCPFNAGGYCN